MRTRFIYYKRNSLPGVLLLFFSIVLLIACSKSGGSGNGGSMPPIVIKQAYAVDSSGNVLSGGTEGEQAKFQADGKLLIRGYQWFLRLAKDGTIDKTFTPLPELVNSGKINSFAIQDDGKIVVVGSFVLSSGRKGIVRLNADGTLDNSFNIPPLSIYYQNQSIDVKCVQLLPNGKLIMAGAFEYKSSTAGNPSGYASAIARLNADQSVDPTFVSPVGAGDTYGIDCLLPFPDGSLLATGYGAITLKDGINYNVVKMSADGVYDKTYVLSGHLSGSYINGFITTLALQSDNKVLIGGGFAGIGGVLCNGIARLNLDGSLDKTFLSPQVGFEDVHSILVLPNNNLLVGRYASFQFQETNTYLSYVSAGGVADTSFHLGYKPGGVSDMINVDASTVLLVGSFSLNFGKQYPLVKLKKQ